MSSDVAMTADDLRRMNSVLRHRLRNFVSGMKTSVTFLSQDLKDQLTPAAREYFPLIAQECDGIVELTNRLSLLFDDVPAGGPVLVTALLRQVDQALHARYPAAALRWEMAPDLTDLRLPAERHCRIVLEELVFNAVEAAPDKPVVIAAARVGAGVELAIADAGPGLADAELAAMFQPFCTTRPQRLGIGLAIARRWCGELGGAIQARCGPAGGLIVTIGLPLAADAGLAIRPDA